jgi:hypothetical protein
MAWKNRGNWSIGRGRKKYYPECADWLRSGLYDLNQYEDTPDVFCRECKHEGSLDTHSPYCRAEGTFKVVGEFRTMGCHCRLPCPSFSCSACGEERPWCCSGTEDYEEEAWEVICNQCKGRFENFIE